MLYIILYKILYFDTSAEVLILARVWGTTVEPSFARVSNDIFRYRGKIAFYVQCVENGKKLE